MEVIVIESETFKAIQGMFETIQRQIIELAAENKKLKSDYWLTTSETAKYLKISTKSLEKYQLDIGYNQIGGKDKRFKKSDIDAWLAKNYLKSSK
ncbi:helix-turn-helix domain-containing protein [Pedobacter sp. SYSU D00535]|uniref:helix-turn-helix domain-containing protein n=1 Tax=Pedobacter sp. SYSU D00535 TaxID=2810308 RepID=UPI001A97C9C9|nr:helix-turn-helix domain-containing protein [Pedobacter sp. SYSU D00535]